MFVHNKPLSIGGLPSTHGQMNASIRITLCVARRAASRKTVREHYSDLNLLQLTWYKEFCYNEEHYVCASRASEKKTQQELADPVCVQRTRVKCFRQLNLCLTTFT